MSDPWPTTGNVAPGMFFMLVNDDFVGHPSLEGLQKECLTKQLRSNRSCYTGFQVCFTQTPRLMMCTWFHCWDPWFRLVAKQNMPR